MKENLPAYTELTNTLKSAGLRVTAQRVAIYDHLYQSTKHPTALDVYTALKSEYPSLSLMTVYNTLNKLVELGFVNELGSVGDGFTHFDPDTSEHINLACTRCNTIENLNFDLTSTVGKEILSHSGYQIKGSRLLYFGTCPACQAL